jgi:hypothetical protein
MRMHSYHPCLGVLPAAVLFGAACVPRPAPAQPQAPLRPTVAYLHGPFVLLNIAVRYSWREIGRVKARVEHLTVRDRATIARLVRAINRRRTLPTIHTPCTGGGVGSTPVPFPEWLSFVRADGSKQHVVYYDPCNGYYIHGIWLDDPNGTIWGLILALAGGRG